MSWWTRLNEAPQSLPEVRQEFLQSLDLIQALFIDSNPVPLKALLNRTSSQYCSTVRLPLVALSHTQNHQLTQIWTYWKKQFYSPMDQLT